MVADYRNHKVPLPELLSEAIVTEIKEAWAQKMKKSSGNCCGIKSDEVVVDSFYGVYDDVYVVFLSYGQQIALYEPCEFEIEGIVFVFSHSNYMDSLVVYQK